MCSNKRIRGYVITISLVLGLLIINFNKLFAQTENYDIVQKILGDPSTGGALMGYSCAIDDHWAILGARSDNSNTGAAYIVHLAENTLIPTVTRFISPDAAAGDYYGHDVAINGDFAMVGAHEDHNSGHANAGAVYVYKYNHESRIWEYLQKLVSPNAQYIGRFGFSVDINGEYAIISAVQERHNDQNYSGAAYIFKYNGNTWEFDSSHSGTLTLPYDYTSASDCFGYAVSIDGTTAVVTSRNKESYRGVAYVFQFDGINWERKSRLYPETRRANDWFGHSVDIHGTNIIVGAHEATYNETARAGAVKFPRATRLTVLLISVIT